MHEASLAGKRPKEKYHSYKGVKLVKIAGQHNRQDFSTTLPLQNGFYARCIASSNFHGEKCYISPVARYDTNEIISYDLIHES